MQWIYHRSNWLVAHSCYLQDLFVNPEVRGGGVGRQLIEHVYAQARSAGSARVHWLTRESNHSAMRLYDRIAERSGFVQYTHGL
ncbi:Acetyltransferase (GNAT) family protein [compost metagenome]